VLAALGRRDEAQQDLRRALSLATEQSSVDELEIRTQLAAVLVSSGAAGAANTVGNLPWIAEVQDLIAPLTSDYLFQFLLRSLRAGTPIAAFEAVLTHIAQGFPVTGLLLEPFQVAARILVTGDRTRLNELDSEIQKAVRSVLDSPALRSAPKQANSTSASGRAKSDDSAAK
jgi:hypothetical protein